eukprot:52448-Chlamydomonas_euryale.AAC.4
MRARCPAAHQGPPEDPSCNRAHRMVKDARPHLSTGPLQACTRDGQGCASTPKHGPAAGHAQWAVEKVRPLLSAAWDAGSQAGNRQGTPASPTNTRSVDQPELPSHQIRCNKHGRLARICPHSQQEVPKDVPAASRDGRKNTAASRAGEDSYGSKQAWLGGYERGGGEMVEIIQYVRGEGTEGFEIEGARWSR